MASRLDVWVCALQNQPTGAGGVMQPSPQLPLFPLRLFADRAQVAVAHVVHQSLCSLRLALMFAGAQADRCASSNLIGLLGDVSFMTAHPGTQKLDPLQAQLVSNRRSVFKQSLNFIA